MSLMSLPTPTIISLLHNSLFPLLSSSPSPMDTLSTFLFVCFIVSAAAGSGASHGPGISFTIVHRDAPRSAIRSAAADTSDLPADMPMKDFIGFGRGMQARRRSFGYGGRKVHPAATRYVKGSFSYSNELVGDFYLTAKVGTPPQKIIFILDTGSELISTRCLPCKLCTPSNAPIFRPNQSSSYVRIPCHSPLCSQSTGLSASCSNSTKSCVFVSSYADGTVDAGYMSVEKFVIGFSNQDIVFGCSVIDNSAVGVLPSSGIMGLNPGPFSFVSQLVGKGYAKKFSYCAPGRFTATNSSGLVSFGETNPPFALSSSLRYTPLVPRYAALGNLYYYVRVTGISLGNRFLPIPHSAFATNATGNGGTVLDSGTTITHLVDAIYDPLVSAVINATSHLHPFSLLTEGADVCYKIPSTATKLPILPTVTFHFLYGATLELGSESILYPAALVADKIVLCLAFLRSSHVKNLSLNIIGNYQQQNYLIEYDLPRSRVGLAKANCAVD